MNIDKNEPEEIKKMFPDAKITECPEEYYKPDENEETLKIIAKVASCNPGETEEWIERIKNRAKEYPETHWQGNISIENIPPQISSFILGNGGTRMFNGDFGIQIAKDGRVWVCLNGIAFLRFSPHPNGKMSKAI